jgi:hypothetical protein
VTPDARARRRPVGGIRKAILDVDNCFTPLEFQAAANDFARRYPDALDALQALPLFQLLASEQAAAYQRRDIAPDITVFADPNVNPADKVLILAFCGAASRLMMSIAVFLQLVPSAAFDVAVLRDPSRNHFLNGLRQYADEFPQLVRRLVEDLRPHRYRNVLCYGASMGGLAALRCGLLLGGVRSISAGGQFPWHVGRLLDRARAPLPAFELLCSCRSSQASDLVCVYGEQSEKDLRAVAHLESMFPVLRWPIHGVRDHNVVYEMWKQGTLRAFYRELFSLDRRSGAGSAGAARPGR